MRITSLKVSIKLLNYFFIFLVLKIFFLINFIKIYYFTKGFFHNFYL